MTGYRSIGIRIKVACWLFGILFILLVCHLYTVQVLRHEELFTKAKANTRLKRKTTESAEKSSIITETCWWATRPTAA